MDRRPPWLPWPSLKDTVLLKDTLVIGQFPKNAPSLSDLWCKWVQKAGKSVVTCLLLWSGFVNPGWALSGRDWTSSFKTTHDTLS